MSRVAVFVCTVFGHAIVSGIFGDWVRFATAVMAAGLALLLHWSFNEAAS